MRILIRKLLTPLISPQAKRKIKRWEYNFRRGLSKSLPAISKDVFKDIMINKLMVLEGDHLFIHGSFSMMNVSFTCDEAIVILLEIVGEKGSITVPTFPPKSSKDTMLSNLKFNVVSSRSGMGSFAEAVRKHPLAKRSVHPIKSVASIGALPIDVLNTHHLSKFAFDENSPFSKMLPFSPKIIGIGAPMRYVSYVHVTEDMNPDGFPVKTNEERSYNKECLLASGESVVVTTAVHNSNIVAAADPEKFVLQYIDPMYWHKYNYYISPFFSLDAVALTSAIEENAKYGNTIYD